MSLIGKIYTTGAITVGLTIALDGLIDPDNGKAEDFAAVAGLSIAAGAIWPVSLPLIIMEARKQVKQDQYKPR